MALSKYKRRKRIHQRIRKKISGTAQKPRLNIFRSNKHIYAQLINDVEGKTVMASSSKDKDLQDKLSNAKQKTDVARLVGESIGSKAKDAGITEVAFDRGGYLYHGRVKALAEEARKTGLKF